MSLTLSPHMRLVALLGALAVVLLGATMFFLTRSGGGDTGAVSEAELAQALRPLETAAKPKPAAKPKAAAKAKPKPPPAVTKDGIPWAIAQALRREPVVVVSLFASGADVDELTLNEARAGARSSGAGFVALDVLAKRNAEPLATFLGGVAEPPTTLVYQRPAALFLRFDGFVDRDTVAQAAQNAGARGTPSTAADWSESANAVCTKFLSDFKPIGEDAQRTDFDSWAANVVAQERQAISRLGALPLPVANPERAWATEYVATLNKLLGLEEQVVGAAKAGNIVKVRTIVLQQRDLSRDGEVLARQLGAPACAL